MTISITKDIDALLNELPEDYEPNNFIITISEGKTTFGTHEVLDGNHRLALLKYRNELEKAEIYQIDSSILFDNGFMQENDNQDDFEDFVIKNGTKISNNEIESIEIL